MDAFDCEYQRLSNLGACDAVFGCEHARVKREWATAGQPENIEAFIRWRANIGPAEPEFFDPCQLPQQLGGRSPSTLKTYRYKPTVEAMPWTDTAANREIFAAWFEKHDAVFETRGPKVVLPEYGTASEGDWILCVDGAFIAMKDKLFTADYEEIP